MKPRYLIYGLLTAVLWLALGTYPDDPRWSWGGTIIFGETLAPYPYRVLLPFTMLFVVSDFKSYLIAYTLFYVLSFASITILLEKWLRRWGTRQAARIGSLILLLYLPIIFSGGYYGYGHWAVLELLLILAALVYMERPKRLALIVVLACLNRPDTGWMVAALYGLWHLDALLKGSRQTWGKALGYALIAPVVFIAMRALRGDAAHVTTVAQLFENNLMLWLGDSLIRNAAFLPLWIAAVLGVSHAPAPLKRLCLLIPPYVLMFLLFGRWAEVRLWLSLFPILLPVATYAFGSIRQRVTA